MLNALKSASVVGSQLRFEQLELALNDSNDKLAICIQYKNNEILKKHSIPLHDLPAQPPFHQDISSAQLLHIRPAVILPHLSHFDSGIDELTIETIETGKEVQEQLVRFASIPGPGNSITPRTELTVAAADLMPSTHHISCDAPRGSIVPLKEFKAVMQLAESLKAPVEIKMNGRKMSMTVDSPECCHMTLILGSLELGKDSPLAEPDVISENFNEIAEEEEEVSGTPPPPPSSSDRRALTFILR